MTPAWLTFREGVPKAVSSSASARVCLTGSPLADDTGEGRPSLDRELSLDTACSERLSSSSRASLLGAGVIWELLFRLKFLVASTDDFLTSVTSRSGSDEVVEAELGVF